MIKKNKMLYEIIITDSKNATIIDKTNKTKTEFVFNPQNAWKLKKYLEAKKLVNIPWDRIKFIIKKNAIKDYEYISKSFDEKKLIIKVEESNIPLNPE